MNQEVSETRAVLSAKDLRPPPICSPPVKEQSDSPAESTISSTSIAPVITGSGSDDSAEVPHHAAEKDRKSVV